MRTQIPLMVQCNPDTEVIKLVEQVSKNTDVIYCAAKMPFPLSDRDFVQKRLYLCNKEDPELVKELGLPEKENKYFVIIAGNHDSLEYPAQTKPIRGKANMNDWIMEVDPNDENSFTFKAFANTDVCGNIPTGLLNFAGPKATHDLFGQVLANYLRIFEGKDKK